MKWESRGGSRRLFVFRVGEKEQLFVENFPGFALTSS
jgi:hypothetical protein